MKIRYPLFAAAAAALSIIVLSTSARAKDEERPADLATLPDAVQKTARQQVGKSRVEEIEDTFEDGQHATEVEYREEGRRMAVVIGKDGTLIQKEHRLSPGEAPEAIRKAVAAMYKDGKISHIKEIERGTTKYFEVAIKTGGKTRELKLDRDGKAIR